MLLLVTKFDSMILSIWHIVHIVYQIDRILKISCRDKIFSQYKIKSKWGPL